MSNPNTIMRDETIPEDVINSMCLTWRHDFGLPHDPSENTWVTGGGPTPEEKEALRRDMRQIYRHHILPAILAERERCAKIAEAHDLDPEYADFVASSIRSSHE